jgi:hypothetical protein
MISTSRVKLFSEKCEDFLPAGPERYERGKGGQAVEVSVEERKGYSEKTENPFVYLAVPAGFELAFSP